MIEEQNFNDTVYIFVDEAGDIDFSSKGSKHYVYYKKIEKYLIDIDLMTKNRDVNHYEK